MSPKRFAGWEPATVTEYEYDDDGRLVRSVTTREIEWDDDERAWAIALIEYESDKCPGCGGQLEETTDPKTEGRWKVPYPTRCQRCTALASAQEKYRQTFHPQALLWTAELQ